MASTDTNYNYLLKFLIIGNAGTGKSCIMHQFIENKFKADSAHTIGVEFGSRMVVLGGKKVKLQIWDTAGQERFRSVTRSYYRGAAGALLVYDITNRESYNALQQWLIEARNLASAHIVVVLVGNKKDLQDDRQVMFLEASQFAQENDLAFMETSALNGENVEETFLKCAKIIISKIESGMKHITIAEWIAQQKDEIRNARMGKTQDSCKTSHPHKLQQLGNELQNEEAILKHKAQKKH
ncbi:Ras-related protein Rab-4B [Toxocara canis]|uniref:Ras-related protein Rab-4B n=1 Tax=Toxocara canis TaxID=6265 RepID=A0A0B2UW52_TOXCA|nr:Ras-related protein Rab-4B [Toxocara canis]